MVKARDIKKIVDSQQDRGFYSKDDAKLGNDMEKNDPEPDPADVTAHAQWAARQKSRERRSTIDVSNKRPTA